MGNKSIGLVCCIIGIVVIFFVATDYGRYFGEDSRSVHEEVPVELKVTEADQLPEEPSAAPVVESPSNPTQEPVSAIAKLNYKPRKFVDSAGYAWVMTTVAPWGADASLEDISERFKVAVPNAIKDMDKIIADPKNNEDSKAQVRYTRASFRNFDGDPVGAYEDLSKAREYIKTSPPVAEEYLYSAIYFQGLSALRRGENENCIMCRGESSCILPLASSAVHKNTIGSRQAIEHFTEYLEQFPEDLDVKWLLNVAYMTLGEHPEKVPEKYLIKLDHFNKNEFGIGKFRDIGSQIGVNRFNQAGGAILDDFDNDGQLDIAVSNFDPTGSMSILINNGQGSFDDVTKDAGVNNQLGGLNCVQTDFNNDGFLDIFIVRGAWLTANYAMRPSLLRNNGDRTFTDVTIEAGVNAPVNSIAAQWSDYDNDGWLDVFICCERQPNRLYHNLKNGTFEEVAVKAGLAGDSTFSCKGVAWIDYDNDGLQDIFLNHLSKKGAQLFRNVGNGTFAEVTKELGINGPVSGFSCWCFDYDNDGFQDIFATCYSKEVGACINGLIGLPHKLKSSALYRNCNGERFEDVTNEVGLNLVLYTMGSNFGDFDNDGFLDMYLGTGDPGFDSLVPNRMFRNLGGRRFADITSSSGTGNLQKGHGVGCGDWDRDGNLDIFIEMGGAVKGDQYHNIMFQNPGHDNNWINLKLVGEKSNKQAIGARIKVVTGGDSPQTFYRHVSSGSSFGGNPMEQLVGIGNATTIDSIEITWPSSQTKQVFRNVPIKSHLQINELESDYKLLERKQIALKL